MPNILRYSNESTGNLVVNGGFEEGSGGEPAGWTTFGPSPPGATFEWDNSSSHDGDYSVRIDAAGTEIGMWQQLVDVTPETIYSLSGYVAFESVFPPGYCNLEVVFRDSEGHVLQFVDLPEHDGIRPSNSQYGALSSTLPDAIPKKCRFQVACGSLARKTGRSVSLIPDKLSY